MIIYGSRGDFMEGIRLIDHDMCLDGSVKLYRELREVSSQIFE